MAPHALVPAQHPLSDRLRWRAERPVCAVLEVERPWTSEILHGLAPPVLGGHPLLIVDGCNRFSAHAFAHAACRRGIAPESVLERIRITRAFTIHQLEAIAADMLPRTVAEGGPGTLTAVLGLERLFLEESIPLWERRQVLGRVAGHLRALRRDGAMLLITHDPPQDDGPCWWRGTIRGLGDWCGSVRGAKGDSPRLRLERRRSG